MDILPKLIPKEVDRPLHIQLLTQMEVWLRYGWLWLFPYGQTIFHHIPDADVAYFRSLGFATAWVVVLITLWKQSRNNPLMRFALIAMCCTLLPSSSIAALQENMAEHRAFQMGYYFLLMVLACMHFHARNTPRFQKIRAFFVFSTPFFIAIFSIASIEGTATFFRNSVWKTEVKLWQEATLHNPHSAKAWYGLGDAHRFAKQMEPALAAYATCTRLDETDLDCWNNLGITYAEMRNDSKAKEAWYHALEINSAYCKAHTNLGFLAYQRQEWDESLVELRTALVYCPDNVSAHYGLGLIYYQPRWDKNKAIHHFDMVLQLQPTFDYASDARAKLLELTW
jgi:tetratricopeptide (TPR) repeat protein